MIKLTDTQAFWLNELWFRPRQIGWGGFSARTAHSLENRGLAYTASFNNSYYISESGRKWIEEHDAREEA